MPGAPLVLLPVHCALLLPASSGESLVALPGDGLPPCFSVGEVPVPTLCAAARAPLVPENVLGEALTFCCGVPNAFVAPSKAAFCDSFVLMLVREDFLEGVRGPDMEALGTSETATRPLSLKSMRFQCIHDAETRQRLRSGEAGYVSVSD